MTSAELDTRLDERLGQTGSLIRQLQGDGWRPIGGADAPFSGTWTIYAAGDREPRFRREGRRCYLEGIVKGGVVGTAICTLPEECWPTHAGADGLLFPVVSNSVFGVVTMLKDGRVIAAAGSNAYFDLSPVQFACA
jgi:hypothetical protein